MENNFDSRDIIVASPESCSKAEKTKEIEPQKEEKNETEEYYELPKRTENRSLLFSLLSVICASLSVCLAVFYIPALILSLFSVGLALYSRLRLGYFDRMCIVGLIVGIFGFVFSITSMILTLAGVMERLLA